jgi:predicted flap endonuclease-1-like 5' DNA nuclease
LSLGVWNGLQDEGITTIDQLKAAADRLEGIVGIGPKMAD